MSTKTAAEQWVDRKRWVWMLGPAMPVIGLVVMPVFMVTGWTLLLWIAPFLFFVGVPILDFIVPTDQENPPDELIEALEEDRYYRWLTYLFIPLQYTVFVLGMAAIAGVHPGPALDLSLLDKLGIAFSVGTIAGLGINAAHELGHKKESLERWLSRVALAQSFYGHFYIEHNRGHHVRVATPEDPASSRMGETLYEFWPRSVWGALTSSWELEAKRLRRIGKPVIHPGNDVLNAWAMSVVLFGVLIAWLGTSIIPFLVIQAVWGFTMLEVTNYLEHYGMKREKLPSGRYERVAPRHSWNSNNMATNVILYHLQRHSDHHANPTRRYQALRDIKEAPVLPTGYAGMIDLAFFPFLWRRVMDHRVLEHYDGDISQVNLHPRARKRYEAKYGVRAADLAEAS